ncbi:MAG: ATP-dependent 6-phosphofructokinase [Saprospiraceae bacterium]
MKKKILVSTGGGDCPGLNAVIRGIFKAAKKSKEWEVWGCMEALNGIDATPPEIIKLTPKRTAGIHVKGGTILKTSNSANPLAYPVLQPDGKIIRIDRTQEIADKIKELGFHALINIGGDGSQTISQALHEKGLNVIGVPKTIDNDLSATDLTFGFTTAVQIATDCFDKLVTTAESHHRVMIMEVMGRDAGWIALHTAVAGGAEICLIPEIPYDIEKIVERINKRFKKGRGFVNIVISEGAKPRGGEVVATLAADPKDEHMKLGGICNALRYQLEKHKNMPKVQVRSTILGHIQRGGTPMAFDRILATAMGVKAFELVKAGDFGKMVSFQSNEITSVPIKEAIAEYNYVSKDHYLVHVARSIGISFGD